MKKTIINILRSIILILLLFSFNAIPIALFQINYDAFSQTAKIIYQLVCDIIFLGIILYLYRKTLITDFKNFFKNFLNNFEYAFKFWLVGFGIMALSNLFISYIMQGGIAENEESVRNLIAISPLFMLFEVSIYAPLTEELIFRKSFKDTFPNKWLFIFISGLTFGSLHVLPSLTSVKDLLFLIPYSSLGITFAYLYYKSNNIFSSICMHAMHNTMAIVIYLIFLGVII